MEIYCGQAQKNRKGSEDGPLIKCTLVVNIGVFRDFTVIFLLAFIAIKSSLPHIVIQRTVHEIDVWIQNKAFSFA